VNDIVIALLDEFDDL